MFGLSNGNMINWNWHTFLIKAAVLTGCFFICSCSNSYQEVQNLAKKPIPVDKALNVESYLRQDGIVKAKLVAPVMTRTMLTDTPKTEFPQSLHVFFYDSTKLQSKLFAKYGLFYNS